MINELSDPWFMYMHEKYHQEDIPSPIFITGNIDTYFT